MHTHQDIKRGLDVCSCLDSICDEVCPYSAIKYPKCRQELLIDAFRIIDQAEADQSKMGELISKKRAINFLKTLAYDKDMSDEAATAVCMAWGGIDRMPTIEVVRCKDCGMSEDAPIGEGYLYCNRTCMVVLKTDFCSYAERKMDAEG